MRMNFMVLSALLANFILLGALLGLLWAGPSFAQTATHCSTAADAVGDSIGVGKELRLDSTYGEIDTVDNILVARGWQSFVGFADTVQVFHIEPGRYMLMASVQGCHVAHVFVEESAVARLKATFDVSQTAPTNAGPSA